MKRSRGFAGFFGLASVIAVFSVTQPAANDAETVEVLNKGDRHHLRVTIEQAIPAVLLTVEKRYPDESRSVLTRIPRLAASSN